jgi:hypothetical protein
LFPKLCTGADDLKFVTRSFRKTRLWIPWVLGAVVILIGARLTLPFALKSYVNHQLNKSRDYSGKIGDVTVHIWRGAYQIHDINIFKRSGGISVPFFAANKMDLSLQWSELFHGSLVSRIAFQEPKLNFVSGPSVEQTQTGKENNWNETLESLVPFKINSLDVNNGQIHFQNLYSKPPVDIYITELGGTATNFTNSRRLTQKLPAGAVIQGKTLGGGGLDFQIHINPVAAQPTFELTGQLTNVDLVALNDFLRAYGKFDVESGQFALFTSFAAKDGKYEGYYKVFFNDLKVFKWEKEKKKNILEIFWQAIVGTLTTAFKNYPNDQLATKIPVTGSFEKTDVHVWPTVETLLHNAFIHALVPQLDQPVKVENVENKK